MTLSLSEPEFQKFIKIMTMTTSDNDNEALVAIRVANSFLKLRNVTWEILKRGIFVIMIKKDSLRGLYINQIGVLIHLYAIADEKGEGRLVKNEFAKLIKINARTLKIHLEDLERLGKIVCIPKYRGTMFRVVDYGLGS